MRLDRISSEHHPRGLQHPVYSHIHRHHALEYEAPCRLRREHDSHSDRRQRGRPLEKSAAIGPDGEIFVLRSMRLEAEKDGWEECRRRDGLPRVV
jgi:hypothetical protein